MSGEHVDDRELARLLDQQIDAMQTVLASMEAERRALEARDGEALIAAVGRKAAGIREAGTLESRRQALLERLGIAENRGQPGRAWNPDDAMASRWNQVLALTRRCRMLNEANGQLIRGQHRRVDGALRILRGASTEPSEYGPGGERRRHGASRSLGSY